MLRCDDEWMVRMSVGLGYEKLYFIYIDTSACAKDANYS